MERWTEHFNSVLNRSLTINADAIKRLPQIECTILFEEFPTVVKTRKAIQHLSSDIAPGCGGRRLYHKNSIMQSIIHLYKSMTIIEAYLSIAGKIHVLAKVIFNRLNTHLEEAGLIPESQCGFGRDRGTIYMLFTAIQVRQEQNVDFYMTSVDFTKANNTVSRDGLWKIMATHPRSITMALQFHDGMRTRVQNEKEYSEPFPVTNGVKQGSVMAPILFSKIFDVMLIDAFHYFAGFPIRYRFDGKLFNLKWLQAKSNVQTGQLC